MVSLTKLMAVCFVLALTVGCFSFKGITPITTTIQLVPSDVAKSKLLGKTCGSASIFGGSGNLSLNDMLTKNNASKVTCVDYDFSVNPLWGSVCMSVYGY
jgi:hypothetical protein